MDDTTRAELEQIKKRVEAATEGPWRWRQDYETPDGSFHWELSNPQGDREGKTIDASLVLLHDAPTWLNKPCAEQPNWRFIAASRTDIPRLLTIIDEQEREIERLTHLISDTPHNNTLLPPEFQRLWESLVRLSDKAEFHNVVRYIRKLEGLFKDARRNAFDEAIEIVKRPFNFTAGVSVGTTQRNRET